MSNVRRHQKGLVLKRDISVAVLTVALALPSFGQSISKADFLGMMTNIGVLNFWSKAPMELMLDCGKEFPETARGSQEGYLAWTSKNTQFNSKVDATLKEFSPTVARLMSKSQDDFQVMLTRVVRQEINRRMEESLTGPQRHKLCANFNSLLDAMLSEDLARPKVSLAIGDLDRYRKYLGR